MTVGFVAVGVFDEDLPAAFLTGALQRGRSSLVLVGVPEMFPTCILEGMTARERPSSPRIDFPVYGVAASWPERQWLDSLGQGQMGNPVLGVRLNHLPRNGDTMVLVETLPRERFAATHGPQEDVLAMVAQVSAVMLTSVTLPDSSVPRPSGCVAALMAHAVERTHQHGQWPVVSWEVDGQIVHARAWQFAGGWAAFTAELSEVYLTAAGVGSTPDGLRLAALSDGAAYGFDLGERVSPRVAAASCQRVHSPALPARHDWHADQLNVLASDAEP